MSISFFQYFKFLTNTCLTGWLDEWMHMNECLDDVLFLKVHAMMLLFKGGISLEKVTCLSRSKIAKNKPKIGKKT